MITDADIQKLAQVFATKDDLERFATKDDLKSMETNIRRDMATKDDLKQMEESFVNTMKEEVFKIYELLTEQTDTADNILLEQRGHRIAIGDHEDRIDVLEQVHTA